MTSATKPSPCHHQVVSFLQGQPWMLSAATDRKPLVAFTTPSNYAARLRHLLHLQSWTPLWSPTVVVEPTPLTASSIRRLLLPPISLAQPIHTSLTPLDHFSAIAFTSRTGITSFSDALNQLPAPPLHPTGDHFIVAAMGADAELVGENFISALCENTLRIRTLTPPTATPADLAVVLGGGGGRQVLVPAPMVVGLEEPPVVPEFVKDLERRGWEVVRVDAYETRWAGRRCAEMLVAAAMGGELRAVVFTSTAEVEGMLKSVAEMGVEWTEVRERCPGMVVAAHGPVTARGAGRLGVVVDVVSKQFNSFHGVVEALAARFRKQEDNV